MSIFQRGKNILPDSQCSTLTSNIPYFAEMHLQEAATQETESVMDVASPKKNKCDESKNEEEDRSQRPVPQSPKRKKQLDTCE